MFPEAIDSCNDSSDDRRADRRIGASSAITPEWSRAIGTLKDAFASVEAACNTLVLHAMEMHAASTAAAEAAAQHIVDIRSESEAAVQRARLEHEVEMTELRATAERLRAQLESAGASSDAEPAETTDAGAHATALPPGDRLALEHALKASRAECAELARRIHEEQAKRARLMWAIRSIQRRPRPAPEDGLPVATSHEPASESTREGRLHWSDGSDTAPPQPPADGLPAADNTEQRRAAVPAQVECDGSEYARSLLDHIAAVYEADAGSRMAPAELIERLAANLQYAKTLFDRRAGVTHDGRSAFEQQLELTLDSQADTVFGRHLAMAAYDCDHNGHGIRPQVA